jgi:uncharacterized OB-fold protein
VRADHAGRGVLSTDTAQPASGESKGDLRTARPAAAVRDGLFTDGDEPSLLGGRCVACGRHHFPRAEICPYCSAEGARGVELSRSGRLWAWTAVTAAPPGYGGEVPYGFGVVELPEGLRVVSRLTEADPARLRAGQPMVLVVVPVDADDEGRPVVTYAFSPAEGP